MQLIFTVHHSREVQFAKFERKRSAGFRQNNGSSEPQPCPESRRRKATKGKGSFGEAVSLIEKRAPVEVVGCRYLIAQAETLVYEWRWMGKRKTDKLFRQGSMTPFAGLS